MLRQRLDWIGGWDLYYIIIHEAMTGGGGGGGGVDLRKGRNRNATSLTH